MLRGVATGFDLALQLFRHPGNHHTHAFTEHRTATLADRRQFHGRLMLRVAVLPSFTHTRFIQFPHQETVRQKDEINVPGLAFAVSQLTISEAEFLLTISVKGLRACPTTAIGFHDAFRIPKDAIRHEYLARIGIVLISPQDHDANLVLDIRHLHVHGQIPLLRSVARFHFLAIFRRNRFRELDHLLLDAFMHDVAIELQIADIAATRFIRVFQAVDVVQNFRRRIKTVERERAEHVLFVAPVDQFNRKLRH